MLRFWRKPANIVCALTLSHQYIDQLSPPVRQAVFGNVGTLIAFRIGYTDAEVMEKEFGKTFTATALADLERYEAVVKLLVDSSNLEPFRAKMLPPLENRIGRKENLISLSRERFAMPRGLIEDKLKRWMAGAKLPEDRVTDVPILARLPTYIVSFTRGNLQGCQTNDHPVSNGLPQLPQSSLQNATARLFGSFTGTDFYARTRLSP